MSRCAAVVPTPIRWSARLRRRSAPGALWPGTGGAPQRRAGCRCVATGRPSPTYSTSASAAGARARRCWPCPLRAPGAHGPGGSPCRSPSMGWCWPRAGGGRPASAAGRRHLRGLDGRGAGLLPGAGADRWGNHVESAAFLLAAAVLTSARRRRLPVRVLLVAMAGFVAGLGPGSATPPPGAAGPRRGRPLWRRRPSRCSSARPDGFSRTSCTWRPARIRRSARSRGAEPALRRCPAVGLLFGPCLRWGSDPADHGEGSALRGPGGGASGARWPGSGGRAPPTGRRGDFRPDGPALPGGRPAHPPGGHAVRFDPGPTSPRPPSRPRLRYRAPLVPLLALGAAPAVGRRAASPGGSFPWCCLVWGCGPRCGRGARRAARAVGLWTRWLGPRAGRGAPAAAGPQAGPPPGRPRGAGLPGRTPGSRPIVAGTTPRLGRRVGYLDAPGGPPRTGSPSRPSPTTRSRPDGGRRRREGAGGRGGRRPGRGSRAPLCPAGAVGGGGGPRHRAPGERPRGGLPGGVGAGGHLRGPGAAQRRGAGRRGRDVRAAGRLGLGSGLRPGPGPGCGRDDGASLAAAFASPDALQAAKDGWRQGCEQLRDGGTASSPRWLALGHDPELVLFDLDGVVVDSETLSIASLIDALSPLGLHLTPDEAVGSGWGCPGPISSAPSSVASDVRCPRASGTASSPPSGRASRPSCAPSPGPRPCSTPWRPPASVGASRPPRPSRGSS